MLFLSRLRQHTKLIGGYMSVGNIINHFMWSYQEHYRVHASLLIESVVGKLDARLRPDVFLVGILVENDDQKHPVCVEPENDFWIQSEEYNHALTDAHTIRTGYKENRLQQSHPIAQENQDDRLFRRSIRDSIQLITEKRVQDEHKDVEVWVSYPQRVDAYLVSVVVTLPKEILHEYSALQTTTVPLHELRDVVVTKSLVDAVMHVLFNIFYDELDGHNPGKSSQMTRNTEDILKSAGREFMFGIACRVEMKRGTFHDFYDHISRISAMKYERREGTGHLIVAKSDHPLLSNRLVFSEPVRLTETRHMRKMLELGSRGSALQISHECAFALTQDVEAVSDEEDIYSIRILGHHHWMIKHGSNVLMGSLGGQPYLPVIDRYVVSLRDDLPRLFEQITVKEIDRILDLIRVARQETHGALIVISGDAPNEALRLEAQSTSIEPVSLTSAILSDLTSMDGAILIDTQCNCHAIGVILDGMATGHGDRARGSRFNSALKYVQSRAAESIPTIALVISEDGTVDALPHIRPRVFRSLLVSLMNELVSMTRGQVARRRYYEVMDLLSKHRFYLLHEDCETINNSVEIIDKQLYIRIVYGTFEHDESMDEAFYYIPE